MIWDLGCFLPYPIEGHGNAPIIYIESVLIINSASMFTSGDPAD